MDLCEITIIGSLGQDPAERETANGSMVTFSVATNSISRGEKSVIWHNIVTFGKTAEICSSLLTKGSKVFIQGRLDVNKFKKEGEATERIRYDVIPFKVICLSSERAKTPESDGYDPTVTVPF